jgi:acyl carrier protein
MQSTITNEVRQFITENLLFSARTAELSDEISLIEAGVIDSTGVLELVAFIEGQFGIVVDDADIVPENLDSINSIVRYVAGKTAVAAQ